VVRRPRENLGDWKVLMGLKCGCVANCRQGCQGEQEGGFEARGGTVFGAGKDSSEDQGNFVVEFNKHRINVAHHLGLQSKHVLDAQRLLLVVRMPAVVGEKRIRRARGGQGREFGRLRNNCHQFDLQSIDGGGYCGKLGLGVEGLVQRTMRVQGAG